MTKKLLPALAYVIGLFCAAVIVGWVEGPQSQSLKNYITQVLVKKEIRAVTTSSAIVTDIDTFVAAQNQHRGQVLAGGGTLPLDYDVLTSSAPPGGNSVTGISGIVSGAAAISLPATAAGNAVIIDGSISTSASTSGVDNYSLLIDTSGNVTVTDNNSGNSETVSGASYFLFDGAATTSSGAYQSLYIIETGTNAEMAAMFNAAFERVPDLAGLEFYIDQFGTKALPDLHTMATYFVNSTEFETLYPALQAPSDNGGANDQSFINELYGQILHRTPTADEVSFYVKALQGTLTTNSGQPIAAADRATLLEYFTNSPENQADISAAKGGWLINPANGAVSLGAMTTQAANAVLASEVATGTVNAADFSSVANSTSQYQVTGSTGGVAVIGSESTVGGLKVAGSAISSGAPNITIDLCSAINIAYATGQGDVVNGASGGGSLIVVASGATGPNANDLVTANLAGNGNIVNMGNIVHTGITTASIINGWNTSDIVQFGTGTPLAGLVSTASATNPASGTGVNFFLTLPAIDLGTLVDTSATGVVAAADANYRVAGTSGENAIFFAQDGAGDTFIYHWHFVSGSTIVTALGIDGAIELVGVSSSSLTNANFR